MPPLAFRCLFSLISPIFSPPLDSFRRRFRHIAAVTLMLSFSPISIFFSFHCRCRHYAFDITFIFVIATFHTPLLSLSLILFSPDAISFIFFHFASMNIVFAFIRFHTLSAITPFSIRRRYFTLSFH
jgi:hypothetical protein